MFETHMYCDGCGEVIYVCCISTEGRMISRARDAGWSIGKYHLCPKCKKNRKKLKEEGYLN